VRQRSRGPFGPSYGSEGSRGCAGRDGSILIYRREPIGAPRAVFCANAGAGLCPAAIGRVTEPLTALLARAACSPCGARTRACVPRRGTGPIPRHDASRFAPLGWTGRAQASTLGIYCQGLFSKEDSSRVMPGLGPGIHAFCRGGHALPESSTVAPAERGLRRAARLRCASRGWPGQARP
jgi:hypothetical protein